MIFGIGIDLIEVERIEKEISNHGARFIERVFTPRERDYCEAHTNKAQNYAARFAAKEAFLKALGTGLRDGMRLEQIEVLNDQQGRPALCATGEAANLMSQKNIVASHVSLTHLAGHAAAVVVLETSS